MGHHFGDLHVGEAANQGMGTGEVDHAVVFGTAAQFHRIQLGRTFHQNALGGAQHLPADQLSLIVDHRLQAIESRFFLVQRHIVRQIGGRCTGTRAENKAEAHVEADIFNQLHGLFEVVGVFTGETDDEVGADGDVGTRQPQLADLGLVFQCRMRPLHQGQNAIGAALYRQMQEADQLGRILVHFDDIVGELDGMAGGVAHAVDAVDGGHQAQQLGEAADIAIEGLAPVGVDVLTQQVDLAHALIGQLGDFIEHVVHRPADFFTAGVGHHAEGTVFGAAFHDGDEGGSPLGAGLGHAVELFDLRKGHVHLGAVAFEHGFDHRRQSVQRLGTEHDIDKGSPGANGITFLGGNAAADTNHQLGIGDFQRAPAAQLMKHLFLRFFANGAGIEQQHIGLLGVVGKLVAVSGIQQVGHLG